MRLFFSVLNKKKKLSLKGKTKKIFLLLFSIILAFFILELFTRFKYPQARITGYSPNSPFIKDSKLAFRLKPNFKYLNSNGLDYSVEVILNSQGFNDFEYQLFKPSKTYRILGLGDSFTFAAEVEKENNYVKLIEKKLNEVNKTDLKYEYINTGVGCYSFLQEFEYLKNYGLHYNPDLVTVGLFVGNDGFPDASRTADSLEFLMHQIGLGPDPNYKEKFKIHIFNNTFVANIAEYLNKKSNLFAVLDKFIIRFWSRAVNENLSNEKNGYDNPKKTFYKNVRRMHLENFKEIYSPDTEKSWNMLKQQILEFKQFCNVKKIEFIFFIFPTAEQLYWNDDYLEAFPDSFKNEDIFDISKPQKILTDFFVEHKIEYIDLLREFMDIKDDYLYFKNDPHWNDTGHFTAANIIIKSNNLTRKLN